MENLVNDLLDLAKVENGSFSMQKDFFNLGQTIVESFKILSHTANEKQIELRAYVDEPENAKYLMAIQGDKRRFMQILLNFLSNSLKFTTKGGCVSVLV